jgi:hypothetical protein
MTNPAYPVDPAVVQDLLTVERCSTFLGSGPLRPEFWELFTLLKAHRPFVQDEVSRLIQLRAEGRPATISSELTEKLLDVRRDLYGLASDLRPILSKHHEMRDGMRLELALVFIMSAARARESVAAWVADPAGKAAEAAPRVRLMARMADAYCRALMEIRRNTVGSLSEPPPPKPASPGATPAPDEEGDILLKPDPTSPPSAEVAPVRSVDSAPTPKGESPKVPAPVAPRLHPQFLEDLEVARRLQRALEGPKPAPTVWEVHALVARHPSGLNAQIAELERLRESGKPGEFAGAAYAFREQIREAKSRHEALAEMLRVYLEKVFKGWKGEAEEIALAVLLGSSGGRSRVERWFHDSEAGMKQAMAFMDSLVERVREHLEKGGPVAAGS